MHNTFKKLLPTAVISLFLPFYLQAVIFTWNGSVSDDWNTPANWMPAGVPGPADEAVIDLGLFQPRLASSVTVSVLRVTDGLLETEGYMITAHNSIHFMGGFVFNNTPLASSFLTADFAEMTGMTFVGPFAFIKNGGGDNSLSGGNSFNGDTGFILTATAGGGLRLANNTSDTFNGSLGLGNQSVFPLEPSYGSGTLTTIAGSVGLDNTGTGGISFGQGGGRTVLPNGSFNLFLNYAGGPLRFNRVDQQGAAPNGNFNPTVLEILNSSFSGDLTVHASVSLRIVNSFLTAGNDLSAPEFVNLRGSSFSTVSGTTTLEKTGPTNDGLYGDNTFGPVTIITSGGNLSLAGQAGDVFQGQAAFENRGPAGVLRVANGAGTVSHFYDDISLLNLSSGNTIFGAGGGQTIVHGGNLSTNSFLTGTLILRQVTQNGTGAVTLDLPGFRTDNCRFQGPLQCEALNFIRLENSTFEGNNFFRAPSLAEVAGCIFNSGSGNTTFIKPVTSTTNNNWSGGNTFGTLSLTNESLNNLRLANLGPDSFLGPASFTESSTGQLIVGFSGDNTFANDITVTGPVRFGPGRAVINGNTTQTLTGPDAEFLHLYLNTTGELVLNSTLTVRNPDLIEFGMGNIVSSPTNYLIFNNSATHLNASDDSYVAGPVLKAGNTDFTFPVGDGGFFAPITVSGLSGNSHFVARYFHDDPGPAVGPLLSGGIDHISSAEYWTLDRTAGGASAAVTLSWAGRSGGVTDPADLLVARWDGSQWMSEGNGGTTGSNAAGEVTSALPVTDFSPFTLASATSANPLPVELLYFRARPEADFVRLEWATATETNNDFFTVERSADARSFTPILTQPGQGNSFSTETYSDLDRSPLPGLSYYRLKQTDFDGQFSYSEVVSVSREREDRPVVFPNPARDAFQVRWKAGGELRLSDLNGRELRRWSLPAGGAESRLPVGDLAAGVYWLGFFDEEGGLVETKRLVVKGR